jgi:hypothetical protein
MVQGGYEDQTQERLCSGMAVVWYRSRRCGRAWTG